MTWTHIVVPTDFSKNAALALETAVDLARTYHARVTVVYVIPQAIFHPDWAAALEDTFDLSDLKEEAQQALDNTTAAYRQDVNLMTHVLEGGPHVEIIRVARQVGAELIVIGAHGTSERQPALLGSVAEKVMRQAPCSVLMVRSPL